MERPGDEMARLAELFVGVWHGDDGLTPRHARPGGLTRFTYDWSDGDLVFTIDRATDGAWAPMHVGRYRRT